MIWAHVFGLHIETYHSLWDLKTPFFLLSCVLKKKWRKLTWHTFFLLYVSRQHRIRKMLTILTRIWWQNIHFIVIFSQCHHLNVCCQDLTKTENNLSLTFFYFHFPITLVAQRGWQWLPFHQKDRWGLQRFLYTQPTLESVCPLSVCMDHPDLEKKGR